MAKISVVTPVYGCRTILVELYLRLKNTLSQISDEFEIIMVNDASPDDAWETIKELTSADNRVKGINLSRNFGQHVAITAGLNHTNGEWIVVMDCDLQDQPEEILNLYKEAINGNDIVIGSRKLRKDKYIKRLFSKWFYQVLSFLTNTNQDNKIGNFGIYHKSVIQAICSMKDSLRYFPTMVKWVGFNYKVIDVIHTERKTGESSYSFKKLLSLGLDVMLAFSDKPLRLTVKLGLLISFGSVIFAFIVLIKYFNGQINVIGYTSLIISIWFLAGIIIFILGIIGLYIGKTFEKVKERPLFIVKESINL